MVFWALATVSFFPSYKIARIEVVTPPFSPPEQITAGDLIEIDFTQPMDKAFVNGREMTSLNELRHLGAVSIYHDFPTEISGVKIVDSGSWLSHPVVHAFSVFIDVQTPKLEQAAKLRIPASVWEKVNDDHAEQKAIERETMRRLLANSNRPLIPSCWQPPLDSKVVSKFASPRSLPNGKSYFHTGLDLRAATGTPIPASGEGEVIYAGHMVVPGNVVVIDHGGGFFSRYMHLSEISVNVTDQVKQGQQVGLAGATGRVEAPHLHWEVVWKGVKTDPLKITKAWSHLCGK